jgi:hypothetical protein
MSAETNHHPPIKQDTDILPLGEILGILFGMIITGIVGVIAAWYLLGKYEGEFRPSRNFSEMALGSPIDQEARDKKAGHTAPAIELVPFWPTALPGETDRAAQVKSLNSYGWVDQKQNLVHIPISRAMEMVVKEQAR